MHPSTACCCTEHTPQHPASRQLSSSQQTRQSPHKQNATCKQTRRRPCVRVCKPHASSTQMAAAQSPEEERSSTRSPVSTFKQQSLVITVCLSVCLRLLLLFYSFSAERYPK